MSPVVSSYNRRQIGLQALLPHCCGLPPGRAPSKLAPSIRAGATWRHRENDMNVLARTAIVLASLAALLPAQNAKSQEQLIALRKEKLAKEVFQKAPWRFDFDAARKEAKESGKPLFVYFTRSYAG